MITRPVTSKIRPDHLDRRAFVYVRQSTLFQVREHTASTARQYDLAGRVTATVDLLGHSSLYNYDAAGEATDRGTRADTCVSRGHRMVRATCRSRPWWR